jgi:Zn-dependent protease
MPPRQGTFRIFRLSGIDVFLHWSWFLVAYYEIQGRTGHYSSIVWNIAEYLALFAIVLTHEFGHALACRQVGGQANQIMLWPFGGVAYVSPPERPGATLWSIAAGPLVNVVLIPVLIGALFVANAMHLRAISPDAYRLLRMVLYIDIGLLVFNILPIYPLDGGQILRSLLWFVLGRGRSLMVATVVGLLGVVALVGFAVYSRSLWTAAIALYMLMNCWNGLQRSLKLIKLDKLERRQNYSCPNCGTHPPAGPVWICDRCTAKFDPFATDSQCPNCGVTHENTMCVDCKAMSPIGAWARRTPPVIEGQPIAPHAEVGSSGSR